MKTNWLRETGLLFEINRTVLNPLGYYLSIDDTGNITIGEELEKLYCKEHYEKGRKKFQKFMNEIGLKRMNDRFAKLKFNVQTEHCGGWGKDGKRKAEDSSSTVS